MQVMPRKKKHEGPTTHYVEVHVKKQRRDTHQEYAQRPQRRSGQAPGVRPALRGARARQQLPLQTPRLPSREVDGHEVMMVPRTGKAPGVAHGISARPRQRDVKHLQVTREDFEHWAKTGPMNAAPGQHFRSKVAQIYQRLCLILTSDERMQLSISVDRVRRGESDRSEYDRLVDGIRSRLWG